MGIGFKIILVILLSLFTGGCINPHVAVVEHTNPRGWGGLDTVCIDYSSVDTLSFLELSLILQINKDYNEEELLLTVTTSNSIKQEVKDSIYIANIPSKRGVSRYNTIVIPFRDSVKLNGDEYKFCISHNKSTIYAVHAVGIEINPSK